ncbi:MAG: DUF4968 domain-containing protein, partial [Anaerolineae bacterium]|nr:DUF4968 domain-containing protein [Anaerolineae bacterium]
MEQLSEKLAFFKDLGGQSLVDDILATEEALNQAEQRYAVPAPDPSALKWRILGAVEQVLTIESGLRLGCEQGWAELKWLAPNCLHVRQGSAPADFDTYFSYAVEKQDWQPVPLEVVEHPDKLLVSSEAYRYRVDRYPLRISVETLDGQPVCGDTLGMQKREDGAVRLSMTLQPDESCYGLGERAARLNLRGQRYGLWNTDPPVPYQTGSDPLYYNIAFY